jgi:hypothetical protein
MNLMLDKHEVGANLKVKLAIILKKSPNQTNLKADRQQCMPIDFRFNRIHIQ